MYKEAVEKYKNTIGYLNPSYVIQKFLDVQRLENLTDYLETLSKQSRINTLTQSCRGERNNAGGTQVLYFTSAELLREARWYKAERSDYINYL